MGASRFPAYLTLLTGDRSGAPVLPRPGPQQPLSFRPACLPDTLSGLTTRQALLAHLETVGALGPGAPLSFVVAKVEGLATLNQQLGWRAGDDALHAVARRVAGLTRATDLVGRLTGSAFGIILQGTGATAAGAVAARLAHHLNQLPELAGRATVAVSVATGTGVNADTLPVAAIDSLDDCG